MCGRCMLWWAHHWPSPATYLVPCKLAMRATANYSVLRAGTWCMLHGWARWMITRVGVMTGLYI
jgi:hypothetical protein